MSRTEAVFGNISARPAPMTESAAEPCVSAGPTRWSHVTGEAVGAANRGDARETDHLITGYPGWEPGKVLQLRMVERVEEQRVGYAMQMQGSEKVRICWMAAQAFAIYNKPIGFQLLIPFFYL